MIFVVNGMPDIVQWSRYITFWLRYQINLKIVLYLRFEIKPVRKWWYTITVKSKMYVIMIIILRNNYTLTILQ